MTVLMTVAMIQSQIKAEAERPLNVAWLSDKRRIEIINLTDKGLTIKEMALHFDLAPNVMYSRLIKANLLRFVKKAPLTGNDWGRCKQSIKRRLQDESVAEVGKTYNLDRAQMQNILNKINVSANEQRRIGKTKRDLAA